MPELNQPTWVYIGNSTENQPFLISQVDVWKHKWETPPDRPVIQVKDPQYDQTHRMSIYWITAEGKKIFFAAGEFSNGIYGFYVAKPPARSVPTASWQTFAIYVPLAATVLELPWAIIVVMSQIGGGPNAYKNEGHNNEILGMVCGLPTIIGIIFAFLAVLNRWPRSRASWIWLTIGSIGCALWAAVCLTLGFYR